MFYLCANRGKRSITIDLSQPEGQELVRRLAAESDVFIENFKAGDLKRYGLDYEGIRAINPRIVYCSVTGFGQTGPYAARPGYDAIFQAMSGIMSTTGAATGEKGEGPTKVGVSMSDMLAGLYASSAISASLVEQQRTGQGRYIDIALLDASFATLSHLVQWYLSLGQVPPRRGSEGNGGMPAGQFTCSDGKGIMITAGNEPQWLRLAEAMDVMHLTKEQRFATVFTRSDNRRQLVPLLQEVFETKPLAYWLKKLDEANVPAGPVYNIAEALEDPQLKSRGPTITTHHPTYGEIPLVANPVKFSGNESVTEPLHPPLLGEHTDEILRDVLSLDEAEIAALHAKAVV